jgi:hypothetical protein
VALLAVKDTPQVGPLQWGWINSHRFQIGNITSLAEEKRKLREQTKQMREAKT